MILSLDATQKDFCWTLRGEKTEISREAKPSPYETLPHYLSQQLALEHVQAEDIDTLAVISGPGNYTGLRIVFSLVRTWHLLLGTPVVLRNRLETFVYGLSDEEPVYVSQYVRMQRYYVIRAKRQGHRVITLETHKQMEASEVIDLSKKHRIYGEAPEGVEVQPAKHWHQLTPTLAAWAKHLEPVHDLNAILPVYTRAAVVKKKT